MGLGLVMEDEPSELSRACNAKSRQLLGLIGYYEDAINP